MAEILRKLLSDLEASPGNEASLVEGAIRNILKSKESGEHGSRFGGLHSAMEHLDQSQLRRGLQAAAKAAADLDISQIPWLRQQKEPVREEVTRNRLELSRQQCLQILAAGFFGLLQREWFAQPDGEDFPGFSFSKLWQYDCERWGTKNFVLMAILIFFSQAKDGDEKLILTRKALGEMGERDGKFCDVQLEDDGVSIHAFGGEDHLQADFANAYLGGGVLRGGGTQEECMFLEFPELLACIYVVEKMLPYEAVEIYGARRYIEHNMSARVEWPDQFCRAVEPGAPIYAVALDAVSYGRRGQWKQYWPEFIRQDLRKCSAALLPPAALSAKRKFVTGLWGCGAFRGDAELKFVIQWISCSLEPTLESMVFCPFDQKQKLIDADLLKLLEALKEVSVQRVFELLVHDDYSKSQNTFKYLLEKLESAGSG